MYMIFLRNLYMRKGLYIIYFLHLEKYLYAYECE